MTTVSPRISRHPFSFTLLTLVFTKASFPSLVRCQSCEGWERELRTKERSFEWESERREREREKKERKKWKSKVTKKGFQDFYVFEFFPFT